MIQQGLIGSYKTVVNIIATKGFFFSGGNASTSAQVDGLDGTDTTTPTALNLGVIASVALEYIAGVSSLTKGFACGGWNLSVRQSEVQGLDAINTTTPTAINPSSTLSVARFLLAGVSSLTKGFIGGGNDGGESSEVDGLDGTDTTTPTAINPSATLAVAREDISAVSSLTKGFFAGGWDGSNRSSEVDGLDGTDTTTPTAINPSATLAVGRSGLGCVSSLTKGFFGGGYTTGNVNEVDGLDGTDTTTPTAINPSATIVARRGLDGVSSLTKGFFGGGYDTGFSAEVDGLTSIDTTTPTYINPSVTLAVARYTTAGLATHNS